jgi:hypothetical protein
MVDKALIQIARFIFGLIAFTPVSYGQSSGEKYHAQVLCKAKTTIRTMRVEKDSSGNCKTMYSKDNQEKVMISANGTSACINVMQKIRKNLEDNTWVCRDISESRVSTGP